MLELFHDQRLLLETLGQLHLLGATPHLGDHQLDRNIDIETRLCGQIDHTEPTTTQLASQPVPTNMVAHLRYDT